jgi:hypothetical protein
LLRDNALSHTAQKTSFFSDLAPREKCKNLGDQNVSLFEKNVCSSIVIEQRPKLEKM